MTNNLEIAKINAAVDLVSNLNRVVEPHLGIILTLNLLNQ
jgi:hypothetical protein